MGKPAPLGVGASGIPPTGDRANAVVTGMLAAVGPGKPFAFLGPMDVSVYASFSTALTTTAGSLNATVAAAGTIAAGEAVNSVNVPAGTTVQSIAGTAIVLAIPPITLAGYVETTVAQITGLASTAGLLGATVTGPGIPNGTTVTAITVAAVAATNLSPGVAGVVALSALPTAAPVNGGPQPFEFARTGNAITVTGADANALFTGSDIKWTGTVQIERSFDGGSTFVPCNIGGAGMLAQFSAGTPVSLTFGEPENQVLYRANCTALTPAAGVTINYRFSQSGAAGFSLAIASSI